MISCPAAHFWEISIKEQRPQKLAPLETTKASPVWLIALCNIYLFSFLQKILPLRKSQVRAVTTLAGCIILPALQWMEFSRLTQERVARILNGKLIHGGESTWEDDKMSVACIFWTEEIAAESDWDHLRFVLVRLWSVWIVHQLDENEYIQSIFLLVEDRTKSERLFV